MQHQNRPLIRDYYDGLQNQLRESIFQEKDDVILYTDIEQLIDFHASKGCLTPLEFDANTPQSIQYRSELRTVPAEDREPVYRYQGDLRCEYKSIIVTVPFVSNWHLNEIFRLEATTFLSPAPPLVNVTNNTLVFKVDIEGYGFSYDNEKADLEVKRALSSVKEWIGFKNNDINSGNNHLKQVARQIIVDRKLQLQADQERIAALVKLINIPLKQNIPEAATRIHLNPAPLVKRIKPTPNIPENYVLDRSKVLDVIEVIDNQGRQFEKTPKTYLDFPEENLRDVILVGLNSLFEGRATGETFSSKGKTDIYLNINKGNILISECKFWGGQSLYHETIDQLLGYLTWRHNFGIMITFSKVKQFSKVIAEAPAIISGHSSCGSGVQTKSPTHFISNHSLPQDDSKTVEIHHLFYNLFVEVKSKHASC